MESFSQPKYPIFIPTKNRYDSAFTAKALMRDNVPFYVVIEPQEREYYAQVVGEERILELPFSNLGQGSIPARNWIKDYATELGYERHWQLDDNLKDFYRWYKGKRIRCHSGLALRVCEDFSDRYENVAISGLNYCAFAIHKLPPFHLNQRVYSCSLVNNKIPHKWRGRYNEDTDICLQVLADGWCTLLINVFLCMKMPTMTMKGGNSDTLYKGDGRAVMSRSLERLWPGVVETHRRFQRPQHHVKFAWGKFDTPLIRKKDIDFKNLKNPYKMDLVKKDKIKSKNIQKIYNERQKRAD